MARERFYPMMRMFDADEMFDTLARGIAAPFFEEGIKGFGASLDV